MASHAFKSSPYGWSAVVVTDPSPSSWPESPASSSSFSDPSSSAITSRSSSFDDYNYKPSQPDVVAPAPRSSAQELYEARKKQALQAKSAKSVSSRLASVQDWAWHRWIAFISCLGAELMEPWEIAFSSECCAATGARTLNAHTLYPHRAQSSSTRSSSPWPSQPSGAHRATLATWHNAPASTSREARKRLRRLRPRLRSSSRRRATQ